MNIHEARQANQANISDNVRTASESLKMLREIIDETLATIQAGGDEFRLSAMISQLQRYHTAVTALSVREDVDLLLQMTA